MCNAPGERLMSDAEWTEVVEDLMDRTGIRGCDDPGGCGGVAVRHGGDHIHIHIAAVLVRTDDGSRVHLRNDYYRGATAEPGEACRDAEGRLGLTPTPAVGEGAGRSRSRAAVAAARTPDGAERAV